MPPKNSTKSSTRKIGESSGEQNDKVASDGHSEDGDRLSATILTDSSFEDQMKSLEEEEQVLQQQILLAEKKKKIRDMRRKLQEVNIENEVKERPGCTQARHDPRQISLADLRKMPDLQKEAEEALETLQDSFEETNCAGNVDFACSSKKSGKEAKPTDHVKVTLKWPHTTLKYNVGQKQITFRELDLASLVAGELSIINSEDVSSDEKFGRIELLKATAYHSKTFNWADVLNFHGTCLLEVEKGERKWGGRDTFLAVEASTLYSHVGMSAAKPHGFRGGEDRKWFCKQYQSGRCRHNGAHEAMVQGRSRLVEHICATCLQRDHVAKFHAEKSADCPYSSE